MIWPVRRPVVTAVAAMVGAALLYWQVRHSGIDEIRQGFAAVKLAGFLAVLALSLGRFVARSAAWTSLLGGRVSLVRALAATISGDALGNLTPLSLLVSEPAKAMYLAGPSGSQRALAALAAENFFYSVSVAIYIIIGTAAMLEAFQVPVEVLRAGIVALAFMAVILAAAGWLAWQRPTLASSLVSRLPIPRLRAEIDRVRDFEMETYGSVGGHTGRLGAVVTCEACFHVLSFLESWLILWLITGSSLPVEALVLDTFQRIANIIFRMVPLGLGVTQIGSEAVAQAIGLRPSIGVTASLVVTARKLVWAAVGLVLLTKRGITAPSTQH